MKRVCVVTGTRAEYGLLRPLLEKLRDSDALRLQLVATGMHLSPEFGLTYSEIERDGYTIDEKVEMLVSSDTAVGLSKSMGLGIIGFSDCYARLRPDLVVLLGDRYEIFAAAAAAAAARLPIAHIHGGETTEGAFDEAFRHSITKMSHLHFTSTEEYRKRVIQLGEAPERVFSVGALGVENVRRMRLLPKDRLEQELGRLFGVKTALVTYHPVTLEANTATNQFAALLEALDDIDGLNVVLTKANSDTDGRAINRMIDEYVAKRSGKAVGFTSMGQLRYLSAMRYADVVVGNSSSGIIEAPALKVPTINIGDRQKGRIQASSVINCRAERHEIREALELALSPAFKNKAAHSVNPYDGDSTSERIVAEITQALAAGIDVKKTFFDIQQWG